MLARGLCSIADCMQADWLHSMSLGVFQDFLGGLFGWLFYDQSIYASRGSPEARQAVSVQQLEQALFAWYTAEKREGRYHTEAQRLKVGKFGTPERPACNLHGSETNAMLLFARDLLVQHGKTGPWLVAARAMVLVRGGA